MTDQKMGRSVLIRAYSKNMPRAKYILTVS